MQNNNQEDIKVNSESSNIIDEDKIVETDVDAKDGQNKCPKCGSTDISLNVNNGKLRCNFCRYEFDPKQVVGLEENISELQSEVIASGAKDIVADTNEVMTFKCSSCGAEVVIDTASATQARCHWCRNMLSVNQQIPNGAVPDVVLPFAITKEIAQNEINDFVGKRKFYANPKFKKEFTTDNIMGVYLPYMIVDINAHSHLTGQAEKLIKRYTRSNGDSQNTYYDADLYDVDREFDIVIKGLTVESSSDKLDNKSSNKTNNVINSIMPFDIEKSVKWDANYLKGYSSEKRDTNIDQLKGVVKEQAKDVSRYKANDTIAAYDRGAAWENEEIDIKGQQWKSAYLPVWLYSYQQVSGNKSVLHYVAVNARTKETMGSVPIHMPKLVGISAIVELLGLFFWWTVFIDWDFGWLCMLLGFVYFFIIYSKYRNKGARNKHEAETDSKIGNVISKDSFVKKRKRLKSPEIAGANNMSFSNQDKSNKMIKSIINNNEIASLISKNMGGKE